MTIFAWVLFAYALFYGVRYLLGARVYLTCALREVEVAPISREQVDPSELRLLTQLDDELAAAGFRHLGFGGGHTVSHLLRGRCPGQRVR